MFACKFAAKYPHRVSALYLDAPVMNLLSCPAGIGVAENSLFKEFTVATGMTLSDLISYRDHPIDKLPILLDNDIPVVIVYGDSDKTVPYCENGALLEKYYKDNGGTVLAIGKEGCGHHPHGLQDNTPIIEFIEKYM
jgi:pimeloyl-ACP methyl ester carboxylesterase